VPETHQRLQVYKRVSQVRSAAELETLREELRDRYGPPPPEVLGLLRYAELRLRAEAQGVAQVDAPRGALVVRFDVRTPPSPERLVRVAEGRPGARLLPEGLRWPIDSQEPLDALEDLLGRVAGVA
jgi:transcription-repair coupling factor (superfamily II helicase)